MRFIVGHRRKKESEGERKKGRNKEHTHTHATHAITMEGSYDFNVSAPVKIEGSGLKLGYWKYRVDTKTSYPTYTQSSCGSYRRYSDFAWLRKALREAHPGCIVPPLPDKDVRESFDKIFSSVGSDVGEHSELHEFRRRALRKFLVRVGAHPRLALSKVLQDFIELDEEQFRKRQKEPPAESLLKQGSAFSQMKHNVTSKVSRDMDSLRHTGAADEEGGGGGARGQWDEVTKRVSQLETSLGLMRDRFDDVSKRRRTQKICSGDIADAFSGLMKVEAAHGHADGSSWGTLGERVRVSGELNEEHQKDETEQVTESLTYYTGLCRASLGVVNYIKQVLVLQEVVAEELAGKKRKREKAASPEAATKLDSEIQAAITKQEQVDAHLKEVTGVFDSEMERFQLEKQHDMKSILNTNVELAKEFGARTAGCWMDPMSKE